MTHPTIKVLDLETNELIEREMNADELAQLELDKAEAEAKAQALAEAEAKRSAILAKLGLTAEEAQNLLG